jgi:putative salt-induced outer membrane protein
MNHLAEIYRELSRQPDISKSGYLRKERAMRTATVVVILSVIFSSIPAVYGEEKKWEDEAELSLVDTGGNTDLMSVSGSNTLQYAFDENFKGAWELSALYGESDGVKNAESYSTEARLDYLFTDQLYAAGIAGWLKDEFAGIEAKYYLGPAVGYRLFTGPKHFLLGEAGLNYVTEKYIDNTDEQFIEGRVFGKYEYAFSKKNKFSQSLEFLYNSDDSEAYKVNSETALISALSDYLSLKASYEIKYANKPTPQTLDDTDTVLSVALVVNF